jgi:hypothetical protein
VQSNDPDAVICCGDLDLAWIEHLREVRTSSRTCT